MNLKWGGSFLLVLILSLPAAASGRVSAAPELNMAGLAELENGNPQGAGEYFLRAIAEAPSNKYYCNNMGASLLRRGEYSGAEVYFKRAVEIDGKYARALSNMAVALFHQGRYAESYAYYLSSMKADSRYTELRFERSRVESVIRKISQKRPEDKKLKKILEYIGSDPAVGRGE